MGKTKTTHNTDARGQTLEYLFEHRDRDVHINEIFETFGGSRSSVYSRLSSLSKTGEVTRVKAGVYRWVEGAPAPPKSNGGPAFGPASGNGKVPKEAGVARTYKRKRSADQRISDSLSALFPDGIRGDATALLQWIDTTRELIK